MAFVLRLSSSDVITRSPFILFGGEVLNVADKFVSTDNRKGAAANQGISLEPGWFQQYEGRVFVYYLRDWTEMILFKAYEIKTGVDATAHLPGGKNNYIGYINIDGQLFHPRHGSATNVAPCKTIQRI